MRRRTAFACLVLLAEALPARAQTVTAAGADALKPYEFLVGAWAAEGEFPGGKYTVELTYRWMLNRKFLQATGIVSLGGQVMATDGWLGYDPGKQKVAGWEFRSDGGYALVEDIPSSSDAQVFEGRLIGGPEPGPVRSTLKREGNDRFIAISEIKKDGAWATRSTLTFTRRTSPGPAASPAPLGVTKGTERVAPLGLLAGVWRTEGESDGVKYAVEYGMHWTLGGHFLRTEYSVTTGTQTELHAVSLMGYDPETKSLVQFGFSADGTVMAGKVRITGDTVVVEGEMVSATRRTPVRVTYSRPDANSLSTKTEMQRQGTWRSSGAGVFQRR